MSSDNTEIALSPAQEFRKKVHGWSIGILSGLVGKERAAEASGRVVTAITTSAAAAKDPTGFYKASKESVGRCIATAALTGIMPSVGAASLAYLVPRCVQNTWQLGYQLSHRGLCALAKRAGLHITAIPIAIWDKLEIQPDGEFAIVDRDPDKAPLTESDLRGVVVLVRELGSGNVLARGWVPKMLINARRDTSDSYAFAEKNAYARSSSTWHCWYVEMAMKTAIHYSIARGWAVIDDNEAVRALAHDVESDSRQDTVDALSVLPSNEEPAPAVSKAAALESKLASEPMKVQKPAAEPVPVEAKKPPAQTAAKPVQEAKKTTAEDILGS